MVNAHPPNQEAMMKRELLTVDDVTGCWAIMPTPSKPNASDPSASDTVDLDESARVAEALVAAGVDGILSLGTLGECATTTWDCQSASKRPPRSAPKSDPFGARLSRPVAA